MPNSNKCEGCVFWEGNDSTYRAKCKKLSDEAQTVTTAFDETCAKFFSRAPEPAPLLVPDLQSMTRGIYVSQDLLDDCAVSLPSIVTPNPGPNANGPLTLEAFQEARRYFGTVRQTFVPDANGDLFDIDKYLREKISDEMRREIDRQILGYPVLHTSMGEGWPTPDPPKTYPIVFGDFSRYMEPMRITEFDAHFIHEAPQIYRPQGVYGFERALRPNHQVKSHSDDELDEEQWDDENEEDEWNSEEELLDLENLEEDLDDENEKDDEGYGGNRRFWL